MTDRPLVTFALFAYNQEKYIREAIEGALSQTYEPLEIILSDDCSTDATFEIMQELAENYHGAHAIVLNKMGENVGTIDHVLWAARKARGSLLIVAAGDDVSLPERTSVLVERWTHTQATALYSGRFIIDESGRTLAVENPIKLNPENDYLFADLSFPRLYGGKVRNIPGYSAAYEVSFLRSIPPCGVKALNEDALTTYIANAQGRSIESVDIPLLRYRFAETSISARRENTIKGIIKDEKRSANFARSSVRFYPYLFSILREIHDKTGDISIFIDRLERLRRRSELIALSHEQPFWTRIALLKRCRSLDETKLVVSRVFGLKVHAMFKLVASRLVRTHRHTAV